MVQHLEIFPVLGVPHPTPAACSEVLKFGSEESTQISLFHYIAALCLPCEPKMSKSRTDWNKYLRCAAWMVPVKFLRCTVWMRNVYHGVTSYPVSLTNVLCPMLKLALVKFVVLDFFKALARDLNIVLNVNYETEEKWPFSFRRTQATARSDTDWSWAVFASVWKYDRLWTLKLCFCLFLLAGVLLYIQPISCWQGCVELNNPTFC